MSKMFFIYVEGPGGHFDMGKQGESKLFYSLKSFIPVTYRICVLTKSKMCCGGPTGFVLYFQPQQFQPIPIVNYTHTHTHSHSLSLSLTHTHTHIYIYVCMYILHYCMLRSRCDTTGKMHFGCIHYTNVLKKNDRKHNDPNHPNGLNYKILQLRQKLTKWE